MRELLRVGLAVAACSIGPARSLADQLFQITEVVEEDEVSPRQAHHVTRWEGSYYVTDRDVTVRGWGSTGTGKPIPFDAPHAGSTPAGLSYVSVFHRLPAGVAVTITYDSFVVERQVELTGPQACRLRATSTLKPGHDLFETRRVSNHEIMFDKVRRVTASRCVVPALVG